MKSYIKQVIILSAIIGGVLGAFSVIPFFVCLGSVAFCLISAATIVQLKRNGMIGIITLNEGTIIGGISGFVGAAAACITFAPLYLIGAAIFKTPIIFKFSDFFIIIPIIILVFGMLGAIFNAFSGMITAYVYEHLEKDRPEEEQVDFIIDEE